MGGPSYLLSSPEAQRGPDWPWGWALGIPAIPGPWMGCCLPWPTPCPTSDCESPSPQPSEAQLVLHGFGAHLRGCPLPHALHHFHGTWNRIPISLHLPELS